MDFCLSIARMVGIGSVDKGFCVMKLRTEQQKNAASLAKQLRYLKNIARRGASRLKRESQKELQGVRQWCRRNDVVRVAKRNTCVSESDAKKQNARARASVECSLKKNSGACKAARLGAVGAVKEKQACRIESRRQRDADRHSCASAKRLATLRHKEAKEEYEALRMKESAARAAAGYAQPSSKKQREQAFDEAINNLENIDARLIPVFKRTRRRYKGTGEQMTEAFLQDMHDDGWFDQSGNVYQATLDEAQRQGEREAEHVLGVKRAKGKRKKNLAPVPF